MAPTILHEPLTGRRPIKPPCTHIKFLPNFILALSMGRRRSSPLADHCHSYRTSDLHIQFIFSEKFEFPNRGCRRRKGHQNI